MYIKWNQSTLRTALSVSRYVSLMAWECHASGWMMWDCPGLQRYIFLSLWPVRSLSRPSALNWWVSGLPAGRRTADFSPRLVGSLSGWTGCARQTETKETGQISLSLMGAVDTLTATEEQSVHVESCETSLAAGPSVWETVRWGVKYIDNCWGYWFWIDCPYRIYIYICSQGGWS